jgi:DNA-binding NtrC family response regulator
MRVLLIEDNEDDVHFIREMLAERKSVGIELEWTDQLGKGVTRLAEDKIDVVLLDLSLPDSHGMATFDRVQAHRPNVPIVVLTGLDDEGMAVQAVRKGAQDYLVKTRLDSDRLVRAIRYAVERHHRAESVPSPAKDRQGPPTILLVDDEDLLREVATKILRSGGYTVLEAEDGNACLKIAQEYPGPIHLSVIDMFMPGMNGREVADHLVTLRERMKVLYMSGYPNEAILSNCGLYPGIVFVHKPFNSEALLRKVREILH